MPHPGDTIEEKLLLCKLLMFIWKILSYISKSLPDLKEFAPSIHPTSPTFASHCCHAEEFAG
jgi:hypothetical protein